MADAPRLTMPPEAAAALAEAYAAAEVILEYGTGGSTVLAAGLPGRTIFAVESDAAWLAGMQAYFDANPPAADVRLHHADIGPTRAWGHPADARGMRRWPAYALSVWDRDDFLHPDVVLIDGRFRVACLLTVAFRCTRPVTVLFDDYRGRKVYHGVEAMLRPAGFTGRMARFEVAPMAVPADRLGWVMNYFYRPA
jgi:hypothetical protein